jgi:hypothetical protein
MRTAAFCILMTHQRGRIHWYAKVSAAIRENASCSLARKRALASSAVPVAVSRCCIDGSIPNSRATESASPVESSPAWFARS